MQEFNYIEKLWAQHTVDVNISADEMLKQAKKDVNSLRTKSLLNIIGMVLSVFLIGAIWFLYDFRSVTTHLGISMMLLVVATYTFILYNNHRVIANSDFTQHPSVFLQQLKMYQLQRHRLYHKLYWFYVIVLSLGMLLSFVEILAYLPLWVQLLILILSFGWIILCSTLIRKAVIKKDKERISLLIEKFERIGEQFK